MWRGYQFKKMFSTDSSFKQIKNGEHCCFNPLKSNLAWHNGGGRGTGYNNTNKATLCTYIA
jgi:hypothetical protein